MRKDDVRTCSMEIRMSISQLHISVLYIIMIIVRYIDIYVKRIIVIIIQNCSKIYFLHVLNFQVGGARRGDNI